MKKEIRDKWCAALRSGRYEQGADALCWHGSYCCLGVLGAELGELVEAGWNSRVGEWRHGHVLDGAEPPLSRQAELGLEGFVYRLIELNDTECRTFPEIADWIEENL